MAIAWRVLLLLCLLHAPARADDADLCRAAIAAVERAAFIPDRLMQAIAVQESGRRTPAGAVSPWPWTINVEGAGEVFATKDAALAAVRAHQARGARSIDIGCMQVNLLHHASAFPSLEQAFDPVSNTRYAASFLQQLLAQTGSWPRAVAGYHSLTPEVGGEYAKKVLAIWARPELGRPPGTAQAQSFAQASAQARSFQPAQPTPFPMPGVAQGASAFPMPSMPGGMGGRAMATAAPSGGGTAQGMTGRGLDSYRAMPTRLAAGMGFRRS